MNTTSAFDIRVTDLKNIMVYGPEAQKAHERRFEANQKQQEREKIKGDEMADKLANGDLERSTKEKYHILTPFKRSLSMLKFKYMLLNRKPTGDEKYPNALGILAPVSEANQRFYAHLLKLLFISRFPTTSGRERGM